MRRKRNTRDKAGFPSPQLSSGGAWPGARLPSVARWLEGSACPSRGPTSQRHRLQIPAPLQAWRPACSVDCGSEANGNRSLRKHESPLPDYVLILLSHTSKQPPRPGSSSKSFPSPEALDSSRPALEGDASILQMQKLSPRERTQLVSEGAGIPT